MKDSTIDKVFDFCGAALLASVAACAIMGTVALFLVLIGVLR